MSMRKLHDGAERADDLDSSAAGAGWRGACRMTEHHAKMHQDEVSGNDRTERLLPRDGWWSRSSGASRSTKTRFPVRFKGKEGDWVTCSRVDRW
jgi:hypothetical protein